MRKYKSVDNNELTKTRFTIPYDIKFIPVILQNINEVVLEENHMDVNIEELNKKLEDQILNILLSNEESHNKENIEILIESYKSNFKISILNNFKEKIIIDLSDFKKKANKHLNKKIQKDEEDISCNIRSNCDKKDKQIYSIRPITNGEVIEISKSLYKTYGDTYVYKELYNPYTLLNLNKCEKMLSYAAINYEGEIISHTALKIENKIGELMAAFTDSNYRGMNCVKNLSYSIIEEAKQRNLEGIFLNAVCTHRFSQKVSDKIGLKACALMLSAVDQIDFRGIEGIKEQRESLLLCFKYLKYPEVLNLYVPGKHKSIISNIYHELGIKINFLKSHKNITYENHDVVVNITENNTCHVYINKFGRDTVRRINNFLLNEMHSIYIYIDMSNPQIDLICLKFEEIGFGFCGVMPGVEKNNLIIQYIHDRSLTYEQLDLNSISAKRLLNHIKECSTCCKRKKKIDL